MAKKVLTVQEAGSVGGRRRMADLSEEERRELARKANESRWSGLTAEERKKATLPARIARKKKARARKRKPTKIGNRRK